MASLLSVLFIFLPIAEVVVLSRVVSRIGFGDTLFLLIFFAAFGIYLVKLQGRATLVRIQTCLAEGRMPTMEMMDGVMVFFAGLLFVFPGFVSDILAVLLLFPLTRWIVKIWALSGLEGNSRVRESAREKTRTRFEDPLPERRDVEDAQIVE